MDFAQSLITQKITLRPFSDFFELARFGPPPVNDPSHLSARVQANIDYYLGNYLVATAIIFLYAALTNPSFLLATIVVASAGFYIFRISPYSDQQPVLIGYLAGSALLLYYFSGLLIIYVAAICAGFVLIHACTRKRSVKSKVNSFVGTVSREL